MKTKTDILNKYAKVDLVNKNAMIDYDDLLKAMDEYKAEGNKRKDVYFELLFLLFFFYAVLRSCIYDIIELYNDPHNFFLLFLSLVSLIAVFGLIRWIYSLTK